MWLRVLSPGIPKVEIGGTSHEGLASPYRLLGGPKTLEVHLVIPGAIATLLETESTYAASLFLCSLIPLCPFNLIYQLKRKVLKAKISLCPTGIKRHICPPVYARSFQGREGVKLLWICWMWMPKLLCDLDLMNTQTQLRGFRENLQWERQANMILYMDNFGPI